MPWSCLVELGGLGRGDFFLIAFHVPSKYMLTARSILLPHAFRIISRTLGATVVPTKLSKVSWSNPVGAVVALRFEELSTSLSDSGDLTADTALFEEGVASALGWMLSSESWKNRRSGIEGEDAGLSTRLMLELGATGDEFLAASSSMSPRNRLLLLGGSSL